MRTGPLPCLYMLLQGELPLLISWHNADLHPVVPSAFKHLFKIDSVLCTYLTGRCIYMCWYHSWCCCSFSLVASELLVASLLIASQVQEVLWSFVLWSALSTAGCISWHIFSGFSWVNQFCTVCCVLVQSLVYVNPCMFMYRCHVSERVHTNAPLSSIHMKHLQPAYVPSLSMISKGLHIAVRTSLGTAFSWPYVCDVVDAS